MVIFLAIKAKEENIQNINIQNVVIVNDILK